LDNGIGAFYADNKGLRDCLEAKGLTRPDFPENERISIDETLLSGYVMQTFDMAWGNVIAGVRIENTEYETIGSRLVGTELEPLAVKRSYTNVLPSVHVNYDINDEQKVRASFSTGLSRPTYIEARAAATISPISNSISGGKLQGIELAFTGRLDNYLEGFFSGFGVEANLSLIDSEYTAPEGGKFNLPSQSDTNYNLSLFYENYGFSARVTYRYRSEWLDETEVALIEADSAIYWAPQERVDVALRHSLYELTGYQASIFVDLNNITDEKDVRYTGARWNPNQSESFGRRFLVGVRLSF